MTKHMTILMIKRHIEKLCLEFKDGRAEKAAKMHSLTRNSRVEAAQSKLRAIDEGFASAHEATTRRRKVKRAGGPHSCHTKDVGIPSLESAWRTREENEAHHREIYQGS